MTRYTLHIPEQYNDGTPASPAEWGVIESDILSIAGGFTILSGIGAWRGDEQDYREPVRLYVMDVAETLDAARLIEALAQEIAQAFDQEAVYLTKQHIETILVTPAREEIGA